MRRLTTAAVRGALFGDFRVALTRTLIARARGKRVVLGRSFRLLGLQNLELDPGATLLAGTKFFGFADRHEHGLIRIRGRLRIGGRVSVAAGCRFDILPGAQMSIGANTYFSPRVQAVVGRGLTIGRDCAIAWDVQFLDDDRHSFRSAEGVRPSSAAIAVGDRVWIGSGAHVYKGVRIADGCVVAGGAVVTRSFEEPNTLIGGSPARVLRSDVHWE